MQGWKDFGVGTVGVSVLSAARVGAGRYEVTTQFSGDPRAAPQDAFYLFRLSATSARIQGIDTGISGSSFLHATWEVTRLKHFIVYHSPFQLAGQDKRLVTELESQRAVVARKFGVTLPPMAALYLYPTLTQMRALSNGSCGTGGEIGCTAPYTHPPTIQALRQALFHEPIHVYQLSFVPPPRNSQNVWVAPLFIAEGMAVALQDPQADPRLSDYCSQVGYRPLDDCARVAVHHIHPLNVLADAGFRRADPSYVYSLGGSFVKYLLLHHGYHTFRRFYYVLAGRPSDKLADYNAAAHAAYGQDIVPLLRAWTASLCGGCTP